MQLKRKKLKVDIREIKDNYFFIVTDVNDLGLRNDEREFKTKQEAFDAQEKYIKKYDTLIPNGYNLSPKGHKIPLLLQHRNSE